MFRFIREDIRNCMNQIEFKIIFAICWAVSIMAFYFVCKGYQGSCYENIRSYTDEFVLMEVSQAGLANMLGVMSPFIAVFLYSLATFRERKKSISLFIVLRENKSVYIWGRAITIFIITVATFIIPLLTNQLLCMIVFPKQGFSNCWGAPPFDLKLEYRPEYLFDLLRIQCPVAYNLLWALVEALIVAGIALLAYGISFIRSLERYNYLVLGIYICIGMFVIDVVAGSFHWDCLNYSLFMQAGGIASKLNLVILLSLLYGSAFVLIMIGWKRYEEY